MRTVVRPIVLSCVVVALVALPGPAQATHDYDGMMPTANYADFCVNATGPTDPQAAVCRTDNAAVSWYADSHDPGELETNDVNALRAMLANEYAPTDLTITYDSTPVFSGEAETDIVYQEAEAALPLPAGFAGYMWCNDAVNGQLYDCDQAYVRIDSPDGYRQNGGAIACHETGHAVGLVHGNDAAPRLDAEDPRIGCMVNPARLPHLSFGGAHQINLQY